VGMNPDHELETTLAGDSGISMTGTLLSLQLQRVEGRPRSTNHSRNVGGRAIAVLASHTPRL
jgi:hypothetical protein